PAQHEVIDGLLDLDQLDIDPHIRKTVPEARDRPRNHRLGDAGYRSDGKLDALAAPQLAQGEVEMPELLVDFLELFENILRLGCGNQSSAVAHEQRDAEIAFQVLQRPADAGLRDIEEPG